ncbi:hypothetical protein DRP53_01600 [candidate division WOR-3 bacterium]|uniref:Uncharacterized protein n=1 Tax=candidate division WOR-3 bacterium TaxID=2052148 RepID=A0A660SL10_UNCW3|nr:MAG: hypothetical protein DRP53_01600 [candidate division WOR-3 bacterium]
MANLILILLLTTNLFGKDKVLHFAYSAGMVGITNHILTEEVGLDLDEGKTISISLTGTIGLTKEIIDSERKGQFSFTDLFWDILGIGLGYLLFLR